MVYIFNITVGVVDKDNRYLYKAFTQIGSYNGVFRENCSIMNPSIKIQCNLGDINGCNYLKINSLDRYYYIEDITSVNSSTVEVSCKLDVLNTYRDYIGDCEGIVTRNENKWSPTLPDSKRMMLANPVISTECFPNADNGKSIILITTGG